MSFEEVGRWLFVVHWCEGVEVVSLQILNEHRFPHSMGATEIWFKRNHSSSGRRNSLEIDEIMVGRSIAEPRELLG